MASSSHWYDFEDHTHDELYKNYFQKNILLCPPLIPYHEDSDANFAEDMGPGFVCDRPTDGKSQRL